MKYSIWMSYDLGVKGDYESLYRWLDQHKAKECGDSVACFYYEASTNNLLQEMRDDLKEHVNLDPKKDRIYVVRLVGDEVKGRFIFGNRRAAPWAGTAETQQDEDDK